MTTRIARRRDAATLLARARHAYLHGDYDGAEALLRRSLDGPHDRRTARASDALLSLVLFQTNRYSEAHELSAADPITGLMKAFEGRPYAFEWGPATEITLPFLQERTWELPRVAIDVNGGRLEASIDTGGDLLSLPSALAQELGIAALSSATVAGSRHSWGRADQVRVGSLTIENVPVSTNALDRPVVGTGLLRQFAPTIDYPGARLVLRPRGAGARSGIPVPFQLAATHLLVALGSIDGRPGFTMLVDSGLEREDGTALLAPSRTLEEASVRALEPVVMEGATVAGPVEARTRRFSLTSLALGDAGRRDVDGLAGWFPAGLDDRGALGFRVDALVSHNFLRHFRWSIDFDAMTMWLDPA